MIALARSEADAVIIQAEEKFDEALTQIEAELRGVLGV